MESYNFSFYRSKVEPGKAGHQNKEVISIDDLYKILINDYKSTIEKIRNENDKVKQDLLKKDLHYFTVSGIFKQGTRKAETLISHSGFIQIDFDKKDNPDLTAQAIKELIKQDEYLCLVFLSPTGTGCKAVAKISTAKELHKASFEFLEKHFKDRYGLVIDKQCKDISRPFFVSYDPDAVKKQAIPIALPQSFTEPNISKPVPATTPIQENDFDKKIRHINKLCEVVEKNGIDITTGYDFYRNIGFAIADGLGENGREYFHRLCKKYAGYNADETNKQFDACKKPGGRKWASLFGIASDYGIVIYPKNEKPLPQNQSKNTPQSEGELKFWKVQYSVKQDGSKDFKALVIEDLNLINLLKGFGFRRYDIPGGFSFVRVENNIVCEVQPQNIQDTFSNYLKKLPEKIEKHVNRFDLESMIVKKSDTLFGKSRLTWLTHDEPLNFNEDTKQESFVYYRNGFVKCTKDGYDFHHYSTLQKAIWKEQMIDRDFIKFSVAEVQTEKKICGPFELFIYNVSGRDSGRFSSLASLIGYLLHDFKETKLKAVVLTDSKISDGNNGRTGKTLFGKALEKVRNVCELNGKEFKADKSFKYQEAKLSTQVVFLNDAMKRFDLETLFNDITEGITIEKKNQSPVKLKVKYLITTNQTIKTQGASSRDRVIEFEFADHYSDNYSPKDEFGHWFFSEWDAAQWQQFDNFMMGCITLFLDNGIIEPDPINLQNRKLIDQTCKQFFDFVESRNIVPNQEFSLQDACENFQSIYPDYDFHSAYPNKRFSKWLKLLPELHLGFKNLKLEFLKKSDSHQYYILKDISS